MPVFYKTHSRNLIAIGTALAISACSDFDPDLRNNFGNSFDTSGAVRQEFAPRPEPDNRGVISYPGYQVIVAQRGDTLNSIADRIGMDVASLSSYNAISSDVALREGEIIALPTRVAEPSAATGAIATGPLQPTTGVDVEAIASDAIDRSNDTVTTQRILPQTGEEPVRHKVERGETAYSVARVYNVSVEALAEWNRLDADLTVREGQFLLIPVANETIRPPSAPVTKPGQGTPTPTPPSASQPLPQDDTGAAVQPAQPETPDLSQQQSAASQSELLFPVNGNIIRPYEAGGNSGIDIAASAGATVKAAKDGTIAAITQDTENVPVLVIRHADNLLTVYANISDISVEKGQQVSRGQKIAEVRSGNPSFMRFEVRRGFDAIDPMPLLN